MRFVKVAKKKFVMEELFDEDRPVFERQNLFLFSLKSRKLGSTLVLPTDHSSSSSTSQSLADPQEVSS